MSESKLTNDRSRDDRMDRFEKRIVEALDAASQPDAMVASRLSQARTAALETGPGFRRPLWLALPLAATAAVAVLTLSIVFQQPDLPEPMPMTADADLLTLPEFDWMLEEPELAAWLLDNEPAIGPEEQSG
jgi:2,4-dienoyl-CoA reductase-like NADH-dependent reductase (Old Yellow Enzyme family)